MSSSSWDYEIDGNFYKITSDGGILKVDSPSKPDRPDLEDELPGLIIGRDLHGNIISLTSKPNLDYNDIMGKLPSTPLTEKESKGDEKNKSVGLIDTLKANSKNLNKTLENQNKLLEAQAKQMEDFNKSMSLMAASLASLSANSTDLKKDKKNFYASSFVKNEKVSTKVDFELTGKVDSERKRMTAYELYKGEGVQKYDLKDSDGNPIIPLHVKAKKDAEIAIAEKTENETDYFEEAFSFLNEALGYDDDEQNILNIALDPFTKMDLKSIEAVDNQIKKQNNIKDK